MLTMRSGNSISPALVVLRAFGRRGAADRRFLTVATAQARQHRRAGDHCERQSHRGIIDPTFFGGKWAGALMVEEIRRKLRETAKFGGKRTSRLRMEAKDRSWRECGPSAPLLHNCLVNSLTVERGCAPAVHRSAGLESPTRNSRRALAMGYGWTCSRFSTRLLCNALKSEVRKDETGEGGKNADRGSCHAICCH